MLAIGSFTLLVVIILIIIGQLRRKLYEETRLRNSESSLRRIIDSLPIGIIFASSGRSILSVNIAALEILKITDQNMLIGKEVSGLFFPFKNIHFTVKGFEEMSSLFGYFDEFDNELILYKKEIAIERGGEPSLIIAFIDITLLVNAGNAEVAANKVKLEFIAKINQEIRTPLNGILAMTEVLRHVKDFSDTTKEKIEIIKKSAEMLVPVINDLMDFSSAETRKVFVEEIPFKLNNEIEIVVNSFASTSDAKGIRINSETEENVPDEIIGDPFIVRLILTNIVSNAVKHSGGEKITISVQVLEIKEESVFLKISVQDDGNGIPLHVLDRINSPNENLTGYNGLKKSKKLAEIIRGNLLIETPLPGSSNGRPGVIVSFSFQAYYNKGTFKNLNFSHITNYHGIKVLIFSENKTKDTFLLNTLKEIGIKSEISHFNNTTLCLLKAKSIDLEDNYSLIIIMDTPDQNGFIIARELFVNDLSNKYLFLMISSNNKPGNILKSKRMGIDCYLNYPYESSEIFDFIQNNFTSVETSIEKPVLLKRFRPNISILVAEDNTVNQKVAQIIFKKLGYEIELAHNGLKALNMVKEKKYDIIFMDLGMPIKNGFDSTLEMRQLGYNMPIIALIGHATELDRTKAMEVGISDFIKKPVCLEALKNIFIKWYSVPV